MFLLCCLSWDHACLWQVDDVHDMWWARLWLSRGPMPMLAAPQLTNGMTNCLLIFTNSDFNYAWFPNAPTFLITNLARAYPDAVPNKLSMVSSSKKHEAWTAFLWSLWSRPGWQPNHFTACSVLTHAQARHVKLPVPANKKPQPELQKPKSRARFDAVAGRYKERTILCTHSMPKLETAAWRTSHHPWACFLALHWTCARSHCSRAPDGKIHWTCAGSH